MLILYVYYSNEILVETIKPRSDTDILRTYDTVYDTLKTTGHAPKLNIIDNEALKSPKILLQKSKT